MDLTVVVDATSVVGFAGACERAPALVGDEMRRAMAESVADVEGLAKVIVVAEAFDTGALAGSLTPDVQPIVGGVRGLVGTGLDYAEEVHDGREPGGPMPPEGELLPWMRRKGIPAEAEFFIRRKIARHGTKGVFFLRRALAEAEPRFRQRFDEVPGRVAARMGLR